VLVGKEVVVVVELEVVWLPEKGAEERVGGWDVVEGVELGVVVVVVNGVVDVDLRRGLRLLDVVEVHCRQFPLAPVPRQYPPHT
jgi:hypothetical protein